MTGASGTPAAPNEPVAVLSSWCEALGGSSGEDQRVLGDISLHPHQVEGVRRLRGVLRRFGGALLADDVGLGKTYTALGVGRDYHDILIVAPAVVREMWERACRRCLVMATVVSYEALSAGRFLPAKSWDLLILDEAHHARTPTTRRYRTIAQLAWGRDVLLVSATPIHNRPRDLQALLALPLGRGAASLGEAELADLIVRRRVDDIAPLAPIPALCPVSWHAIPPSPEVLAHLRSLPPPLPQSDGGVAEALVALGLLRAWCSSDSALLAGLRRRLAVAAALEHALAHGRHPSRDEIGAWSFDETGDVQLAFAEIVAAPSRHSTSTQRETVRRHAAALRALQALVTGNGARDAARVAAVRLALDAHPGERVVIFSHSIDTARWLFRALTHSYRVALLTGRGGQIASGSIRRADILSTFCTRASPAQRPPKRAADRIDVLVASDVVSEGVDLQGASVLIHVDLPWTLARLEQRIGRVRRLGSDNAFVSQHAVAPPVDSDELSHLVQHLVAKATTVHRVMGNSPLLFGGRWPFVPGVDRTLAPATAHHAILGRLRRLRDRLASLSTPPPAFLIEAGTDAIAVPVACTPATVGALALVEESGNLVLVAQLGASWSNTAEVVNTHLEQLLSDLDAETTGRAGDHCETLGSPASRPIVDLASVYPLASSALESALAWCQQRDAARQCVLAVGSQSTEHRHLMQRLRLTIANASRIDRPLLARREATARAMVLRSRGVGAEGVLAELLTRAPARPTRGSARERDEAARFWLDEVINTLGGRIGQRPTASAPPARVRGILLPVTGRE